MDLETVLLILGNQERRNEFILRLKSAGEDSQPALNLKNAMIELKMNKQPKGIHQKTMLQHTFTFSDSLECFENFRLVCKSWKDAVETIKFNAFNHSKIWKDITGHEKFPIFHGKFLKIFKKLRIRPWHLNNPQMKWPQTTKFILNHMEKLNEIDISGGIQGMLSRKQENFILQILQTYQNTLKTICLSKLIFPNTIKFPNMQKLELIIGEDITKIQFENHFEHILKNMENLEIIRLDLWEPHQEQICSYIGEHYAKHCISASGSVSGANAFPLRIFTNVRELENLEHQRFTSLLEYLDIEIDSWNLMGHGWNRYQEIFNQCLNLKKIAFSDEFGENLEISNNLEIWSDRMHYFQTRNIEIVHTTQIDKNENLELKIAKEIGLPWLFSLS